MNVYDSNPNFPYPADNLFSKKIRKMSNIAKFEWSKTCWFHLTRTTPTNQFENGLLPLGENLDYLWDLLFFLQKGFISKSEWSDFRNLLESSSSFDSAFQYQLKYNDKIHWGPYGMLIREAAFHSKDIGNYDYLDVPEIIDDICNPFHEKYGYDLLGVFKDATVPCIVKFETAYSDVNDLGTVVNFLYHKH